MNKTTKTKWVEALRSGQYEQGRGALRSIEDKYCCLGVLADIVGCNWKLVNFKSGCYVIDTGREDDWFYDMLTPELIQNLRLKVPTTLAVMNDEGMTFSQIADWIETNLEVDNEENS